MRRRFRRTFLVSALLLALAALAAPGTASAQAVDRAEIEPNNSIAMPDPVPVLVDTDIHGSISTPSDLDFFRVIVSNQPTLVRFQTWVPDRPLCDPPFSSFTDTVIRLWDSAGTQIAANDDGGLHLCSLLVRTLAPGTYFISVEDFARDNPIPAYTLEIDLHTTAS